MNLTSIIFVSFLLSAFYLIYLKDSFKQPLSVCLYEKCPVEKIINTCWNEYGTNKAYINSTDEQIVKLLTECVHVYRVDCYSKCVKYNGIIKLHNPQQEAIGDSLRYELLNFQDVFRRVVSKRVK